MTQNFYQDGNNFLEPSVHNLCTDGKGKTVSDFPLIYYSVAQLWKAFGKHEFIYRGLVLLLFFLGLLALFKVAEHVLEDSILGLFAALMLFTSPTLVYYANNFLMNIPALALAMMAFYCFYRFYRYSNSKYLWLSMVLYTIAGLLKTPSLMSYVAISGVFVLELLGISFKKDDRIFNHPKSQFLPFLLVPIAMVLWYTYAHNYNAENCHGIFLVGILPIWELDKTGILDHLDHIRAHLKWDYFQHEAEWFLMALFGLTVAGFGKIDRLFGVMTILLAIGLLCYATLFFQPLRDHDYYTINQFILVPFVTISGLLALRNFWENAYHSMIFKLLLALFFIYNMNFTERRMKARYHPESPINEAFYDHMKALQHIRPFFEDHGISNSDPVIFLNDNSINSSLYLMNQKGWTNYNVLNDPQRIEQYKQMGAKYLLVYDEENFPEFEPYFKNEVGRFATINVYKLQ